MADKFALVTGAKSRLGKATALESAKPGAPVVMVCRRPQHTGLAVAGERTTHGHGVRVYVRKVAPEGKKRSEHRHFRHRPRRPNPR